MVVRGWAGTGCCKALYPTLRPLGFIPESLGSYREAVQMVAQKRKCITRRALWEDHTSCYVEEGFGGACWWAVQRAPGPLSWASAPSTSSPDLGWGQLTITPSSESCSQLDRNPLLWERGMGSWHSVTISLPGAEGFPRTRDFQC